MIVTSRSVPKIRHNHFRALQSGTAAGSERCRDFRVNAPLPAGGRISVQHAPGSPQRRRAARASPKTLYPLVKLRNGQAAAGPPFPRARMLRTCRSDSPPLRAISLSVSPCSRPRT